MAHIPLSDKAITLDEVNRLQAQTPISIQTNTDGYEDKLTKIQQILKTSAELQLVIAAYYNELIINSNNHPQTILNFNNKNFTWDSVTITKAGTPGATFTLTKDGTFNIETAIPQLAISWRTQRDTIVRERQNILDTNPTRPSLRDGGRPSFLSKYKKKKKKTSIKRR